MDQLILWLASPIDPSLAHDLDPVVAWHGRLMIFSWSFAFPLGILAARFFKIMPGQQWPIVLDNPAWWIIHLVTQYLGGLLALIAVALLLAREPSRPSGVHGLLGWMVMMLLAGQFLSGWLRGSKGGPTEPAPDGTLHGDHFDMTLRRRIFEYFHKSAGYVALILSCAAIVAGLYLANAPRWMWICIGAWWLCILILIAALQRRGLTIDTYQAIWGPDKALPGNKLRPIGLGITRLRKDGTAGDRRSR